MKLPQFFLLLGGACLLIGTFLPWVTYSGLPNGYSNGYSSSIAGYQDGGIITGSIGLFFIIRLIVQEKKHEKLFFTLGRVFAILANAIVLISIADAIYSSLVYTESGAGTDVNSGLFISLLGAVLALIGDLAIKTTLPETSRSKLREQ